MLDIISWYLVQTFKIRWLFWCLMMSDLKMLLNSDSERQKLSCFDNKCYDSELYITCHITYLWSVFIGTAKYWMAYN